MIPKRGCDPVINLLTIGAEILKTIKNGVVSIDDIFIQVSNQSSISVDHVILTLDWLYSIRAIKNIENGIYINET